MLVPHSKVNGLGDYVVQGDEMTTAEYLEKSDWVEGKTIASSLL